MSNIQLYNFDGHEVRITDRDENPWFVFTDLCRILGYANPSDVKNKMVREKYQSSISLDSGGSPAILNTPVRKIK